MMRRAIVLLVLGGIALALYVVGVVIMLSVQEVNEIPTPGFGVIGGMLAMFGALAVFVTGFVMMATEQD